LLGDRGRRCDGFGDAHDSFEITEGEAEQRLDRAIVRLDGRWSLGFEARVVEAITVHRASSRGRSTQTRDGSPHQQHQRVVQDVAVLEEGLQVAAALRFELRQPLPRVQRLGGAHRHAVGRVQLIADVETRDDALLKMDERLAARDHPR
jgi:hypothetical protein